jgi:hypothetical protein
MPASSLLICAHRIDWSVNRAVFDARLMLFMILTERFEQLHLTFQQAAFVHNINNSIRVRRSHRRRRSA